MEEAVPELLINSLEIHLRNLLTSTISKIRANRIDCVVIPPAVESSLPHDRGEASLTNGNAILPSTSHPSDAPVLHHRQEHVQTTLDPEELAFTYTLAPHIHIEPSHPISRMVATRLIDATPLRNDWSEVPDGERKTQRAKVAMMLDELL